MTLWKSWNSNDWS